MFGHERGAFTGATERRLGRFELAHGGTLFLDEIGDLSAEAQAKLLRTLETGELQRIGGGDALRTDVRIVSATNRPAGARGRRRATSGRTSSSGSTSSPSTSRRCASGWRTSRDWWIHLGGAGAAPAGRDLHPGGVDAMRGYPWPGNVRELANLVERLSILCGPTVDAAAVRGVLPRRPSSGAAPLAA